MDTPWGRRRERRLAEAERYRAARRLVGEDVAVLGEELTALHLDTLAETLDPDAVAHYRDALARYEEAGRALARAEAAEDADAVLAVARPVEDARWHRACVLALLAGQPLPIRRDPCFFDPRHLPAVADVRWRPPGGVPRDVAVCPACRERLEAGAHPDVRLVRVGELRVPWWEAGRSAPAGTTSGRADHPRAVHEAAVQSSVHRVGGALQPPPS